MRTARAILWLAAFAAILASDIAGAQVDQGLSEQQSIEPWLRAKAVAVSLGPLLDGAVADEQRRRVDSDLSKLGDELSALQAELERVAIRIVAVPEFAYEASDKATELSAQVLGVETSFDALFEDLNISQRPDVQAMQSSIRVLQQALHKRDPFERDVIRAIGSGSKNEMQALAGQWWRVGESVEGVKLAVGELRSRPGAETHK